MTVGEPERIAAGRAVPAGTAREVLLASLQLGSTSFGGPIAHLGYFEQVYVRQRRWLSGEDYAHLVALCQILPGPSSSQVGFLIGLRRAGWRGALAAWAGFTLPSALLMYAGAIAGARLDGALAQSVVHGLKLVAVAVVAQAVWSMGRRLLRDRATAAIALAAAAMLLVAPGSSMQLGALAFGAAGGAALCRSAHIEASALSMPIARAAAWTALALYALLLLGLPLLAVLLPGGPVELAAIFYRAGALVFGGGHVVLPLLRDAMVPAGWISDDRFLTGYGLAQALPGPLFTLSAYLGAAARSVGAPAAGATLALLAIFLPGLLMAVAGAALWDRFAGHANLRAGLAGVNAAVVGILAAALYNPVWVSAVRAGADAAIAIAGLAMLERWKAPPVAVVATCVLLSIALGLLE